MKITTKSGFKFDFDERMTDDWRVLKAIGMADNKDDPDGMIAGSLELVTLIFGKDEKRLIEHIQSKNDGFVPVLAIKEELADVFTKARALKNSKSSQA